MKVLFGEAIGPGDRDPILGDLVLGSAVWGFLGEHLAGHQDTYERERDCEGDSPAEVPHRASLGDLS